MGVETKILVVEDDLVVRGLVTDLLEASGFSCTCVSTCAQAREIVEGDEFACGLIDLGLPDGNGLAILPGLKRTHPWLVPIILTGDHRAETIVDTMRAGAFDYLTKPFSAAALKAAVVRALDHHNLVRDRDELFALLAEEREQLKVRVEAATADLRQYAGQIETANARLQSLLRLTQVSEEYYTDEVLFRGVFEELDKYMPIQCVVLCVSGSHDVLAAFRGEAEDIRVIVAEGACGASPGEPGQDCKDSRAVATCVERHTGLDTGGAAVYLYPQTFWGRTLCTVAFFLSPEFEVDAACDEFLSTCARLATAEWQEAQLLFHAVREASLGDIALELSKGFVQGLTAIRMAADVAEETHGAPEVSEALRIICDNVENIQRQIQEFRQLSTHRRDSVETVYLDEYIDQAIEMLSSAVLSRGIAITKEYQAKCECVLINGTALARTFLDLISNAVRTVDSGGRIVLRLADAGSDSVVFEISCDGMNLDMFGMTGGATLVSPSLYAEKNHPRFMLAERTVRSCGGKLSLDHRGETERVFRIQLPRNAVSPCSTGEGTP